MRWDIVTLPLAVSAARAGEFQAGLARKVIAPTEAIRKIQACAGERAKANDWVTRPLAWVARAVSCAARTHGRPWGTTVPPEIGYATAR